MTETHKAAEPSSSRPRRKAAETELAFCPCHARIPTPQAVCEACHVDLGNCSARSYAERLTRALGRPSADIRIRAIIALGWRHEKKTDRALVGPALTSSSEELDTDAESLSP